MTETLPTWFWMPAAALLWGYLIVDAIARRHHHRKEHTMDTIVIARNKREGLARFPKAVAVVTPHRPEAARGISAHRIVVLRSMDTHPRTQDLIAAARPALAFQSSEIAIVDDEPETTPAA